MGSSCMTGLFRSKPGKSFMQSLGLGTIIGFTIYYLANFSIDYRKRGLTSESFLTYDITGSGPHPPDDVYRAAKDAVAQDLSRKVRVLCFIVTASFHHKDRAQLVKSTWGKRCNILFFMSNETDPSLPAIGLEVEEGIDSLWNKTKKGFKHAYDYYFDKADWFLKAEDDTYVVVENLRYMLSNYSASEPAYFGCRTHSEVKQGHMFGGAGYVISKESLRRLVEEAFTDVKKCSGDDAVVSHDLELGKCLENVGVTAMDSRDQLGRGRFFPYGPEQQITPGKNLMDGWYWKEAYNPAPEGMNCCSDLAISFHNLGTGWMYTLEYMIYHLRPYGISYGSEPDSIMNAAT